MLIKLTGTVSYRGLDYVILDVGPVGYRLHVPEFGVPMFHGEMTVYTHEVHREDAHELFGFPDRERLELFWKLISVSGVGPRSAQKIVFRADAMEARKRIMEGDIAFLTSTPGVGTKTAQKIILELKGQLAEVGGGSENGEAIEALVGLGYSRKDALEALHGLSGTVEEKIRSALKVLSRS